jgi:hypothetical protein
LNWAKRSSIAPRRTDTVVLAIKRGATWIIPKNRPA